jgi:hypothetical protein
VRLEQQLLGAADPVALAVVCLGGQLGILPRRDRQARRPMDARIEEAPVDGGATDRQDATDATPQHLRDAPQPPVGRDDDVERQPVEHRPQALLAEHVAVQVPQVLDLGHLVPAGVEQGHVVAPSLEPQGDRRTRRTRPTDQQRRLSHMDRLYII